MNPYCGLILAGGAGRRFGRPKAFATLPDGVFFLEACFKAHTEAKAVVVAATLPPGPAQSTPADLILIPLPGADLDMFESLRIGLRRVLRSEQWQTVVIHPVDHPLVQPSTIRALVGSGHTCAIASLNGRHGHPIAIDRTTAEEITSGQIAGPTLREVLRRKNARSVAVDDPGVRVNCNTPEILEAAWRSDHRT